MENWRNLYTAAQVFKNLGCWEWMYDSDVFGVLPEAKGEIGYCAVLGARREVFALVVYAGTEGLHVFEQMYSEELAFGDPDVPFMQNCLMASFENRADTTPQDRQIIKKLGLKFRGKNAWPMFRSYRPGYEPWIVDQDEAVLLTHALQQAIVMGERCREDDQLLISPPPMGKEGCRVIRARTEDGWHDEWLPQAPAKKKPDLPAMDEVGIARALQLPIHPEMVWEIDSFFMTPRVFEERLETDRPYHPRILIAVSHGEGIIVGAEISMPWNYREQTGFDFLKLITKTGFRPHLVLVRREELFYVLQHLASELEINLDRVRAIPAVEAVRAHMAGITP